MPLPPHMKLLDLWKSDIHRLPLVTAGLPDCHDTAREVMTRAGYHDPDTKA